MKIQFIAPALVVWALAFGVPASVGQNASATVHFCNGLNYSVTDFNNAIAAYTRAIAANPRYAEAYFYRGNSYYARGRWHRGNRNDLRGAIANYNQALKLGYPRRNDVLFNRANARGAVGDYRGALADFNEAIRTDRRPGIRQFRALAHYFLRNRNAAIADLQAVANAHYQSGSTERYQSIMNVIAAIKKGQNPTNSYPNSISWAINDSIEGKRTRCPWD